MRHSVVTTFLSELGKTDSYIDDNDPDWIVIDGIYTSAQIGAAISAAQPEPSDAQVRAALRVFFDGNPDFMSDPSNVKDMRAALRAAGGVR